ncbi:Flp pilus assembly complex ATPase component TadA [candidate division KSB1 bacterium]|nr:Flp pilus assembly complex ATPase component TadA [candidate division KSB1 bacterium]
MSVDFDKIGNTLLEKQLVDRETLIKAAKVKEFEKKRSLAQILVDDYAIEHDTVFSEVASLYGFRKISLAKENINKGRIEFIRKMFEPLPEPLREQMREEKILVLRYDPNRPYKIIIIAADPTNRKIPMIARVIGAKRYEVCYVRLDEMQYLLDLVFPPQNEFLANLEDQEIEIEENESEEDNFDEAAIEAEINKSMLVNLVEGMLIEAVRRGVSDIHIIPKNARTTEIHFRVDGKLQLWHVQEGVRPEAMAAVAKDRSKNIDRFEREVAQDGFIQRKVDGHMIRYRVSVLPIVASEFQFKLESIVIRVLDDRKVIADLDKLGFQGKAKEYFIKAISKPQGMIIVTGPTGSGKSTTLMAALNYIIKPEINILTVEDPVEYIIKGARQIKISEKNDFERALRAILRHDPDVVMVGEIRDKITAETGIKMANTGHLTFSTLHTNDAPSAISRLYKMGLEPFLIAYAINIIIAQRLIRKVCDNCKRPIEDLDPVVPKSLGFTDEEIKNTIFYEPVGCDKCNKGYKGRVAIHEALFFSKEIRRIIFKSGNEIDEEKIREAAIADGMFTLRASGRVRVMAGTTTLEEVAYATSED